MPDVYANIAARDRATQEQLADVLELRAADERQREMLEAYLAKLELSPGSVVLEVGCGTGAVSRRLAAWQNVAQVIGLDPSAVFVERARASSRGFANLRFVLGDGRALPFEPGRFDAVVVHTTASHVPDPQQLFREAFRVLRPGASLAVFDGDYATASVALAADDPLECCMDAFREAFVHDPWLVRRLSQLVRSAGFSTRAQQSHGYVEVGECGYLSTWIERGARELVRRGEISAEQAAELRAEARRRGAEGRWFGQIAFASLIGVRS